jgi:PAS domain S-box-containing protein
MKGKMEDSERNSPGKKECGLPFLESSLYQLIVENSKDFIFLFDGSDKCIYANPVALKAFGFSQDEVKKIDFLQIVHSADRGRLKKEIGLSLAGREAQSRYEFSVKTKTGDSLMVESFFRREYNDKNDLLYTQVNCRDITAIRTPEEITLVNKRLLLTLELGNLTWWEWDFTENVLWAEV